MEPQTVFVILCTLICIWEYSGLMHVRKSCTHRWALLLECITSKRILFVSLHLRQCQPFSVSLVHLLVEWQSVFALILLESRPWPSWPIYQMWNCTLIVKSQDDLIKSLIMCGTNLNFATGGLWELSKLILFVVLWVGHYARRLQICHYKNVFLNSCDFSHSVVLVESCLEFFWLMTRQVVTFVNVNRIYNMFATIRICRYHLSYDVCLSLVFVSYRGSLSTFNTAP